MIAASMHYLSVECQTCHAKLLDYWTEQPEGWRIVLVHHQDGTHEAVWLRPAPPPERT